MPPRLCPASPSPRPFLSRATHSPMAASRQMDSPSALVVFVDRTECAWLRSLKRGFRHCFVVIRTESSWLICDSLKDRIELSSLDLPRSFDLAGFYADQGHHVLVGQTTRDLPRAWLALAPLTCVSVAKRLLGIRAAWVLTPWQLFAYLSSARSLRWRVASGSAVPEASPIHATFRLDNQTL
jgi:hypothetical protein